MKQKIFQLLLAVITVTGAHAQTTMILHQKSGADVEVYFADKPIATFEGKEMVLTTAKTTLYFLFSELGTITYEDKGTSAIIESITQLSHDSGPSRVYDDKGHLLKTVPEGQPVSFGSLPKGLYIVKNNNTSYKISRK